MSTRKPKYVLDLEKQVVDLKSKLTSQESTNNYLSKANSEKDEIINGLHDILDDLGVRGYRDSNKYIRIPLPVRLFAWSMGMVLKKEEKE